METVKVEGRSSVASLLRRMADGIDDGVITLGEKIDCSDDLVAIVNAPEQGTDHLLLLNVRFESGAAGRRHLAVEEELSHPGA